MDINVDIAYLKAQLDKVQDPDFISKLKSMVENRLRMKKVKEQRISIDQYNKEIDHSIIQIENGEYITQEEIEKRSIEWLK